jgi:hypothetical protein
MRHARLCQTVCKKIHRNFSLNSCEFGKSLSQTEICNSSFIHKMRIMQEENGRRANITATVCPPLPLLESDLSPNLQKIPIFSHRIFREGSPYPEAPPPEHQATPQSHRPTETKLRRKRQPATLI